jgi:outer membrane protein TolC
MTGDLTMNPESNINVNTPELRVSRDEAAASSKARRAAFAAHASGRRRFVDPATSERDYVAAELEFMQAMQAYKQSSGRMFPTWSEALEVLQALGYEKIATTGSR